MLKNQDVIGISQPKKHLSMEWLMKLNNWWKRFVKKHIIDMCPKELDDLFQYEKDLEVVNRSKSNGLEDTKQTNVWKILIYL